MPTTPANSPEQARQRENGHLDKIDNLATQEALKTSFNKHPEVKLASEELSTLVSPEEKDILLSRLLLKFEKDAENFDFAASLHKVFYWEDISGMRSSGIDLENKNDIYQSLMTVSAEGLGVQEDSESIIDNSTEEITSPKESDIDFQEVVTNLAGWVHENSDPIEAINAFTANIKGMTPEERLQYYDDNDLKTPQWLIDNNWYAPY